ncbi:peptide ABC transporter substrate-binding protein [Lentilactobacillus sp. Marseille-Q4993]|uniref:peptide ABC transporter substrate-binding protein n=1 Tax=Lentilactobacillus sp. Marseille-Q4993 TaxID=3039492 RepID=UPI0024BCF5C5|nr:peptide ABC transporter substrate-binding protein [Lentilactobacillus sp. Marseille-Q4993]
MLKKSIKRTTGFVSIVALGLVIAACGSKKADSNGLASNQTINLAVSSEPTTLDIAKITDSVSFQQVDQTTDGLYKYDSKGKVVPALATKLAVSKDGKTYTIDIRHDSKWSNGDKVTAEDFVYSWQRAVTPKTASQYTYLFSPIKNADEIASGKLAPSKLGVKASGKYQLKVTLNKPTTYFKLVLARETLYPLDKKAVDKFGSKYGTQSKYTVYNGAFISKGWTGSNDSWTLVKNKNYWNSKAVKADKLSFKVAKSPSTSYSLYQAKKLDIVSLTGEQAAQLKNNKDAVERKLAATKYLLYNQRKSILKNKNIRLAFSLSINRKQLTNKVLQNGSTPSKTYVPEGFAKNPTTKEDFAKEPYVKNTTDYNPSLAKKYYEKGLKELGKTSLNLNLMSSDDDQTKSIVEFIQSNLQQNLPGLKINLQSVPLPTLIARDNEGNFDITYIGWSADFADPISFLSNLTSKSPENSGKWANSDFDKAIENSNNRDANNAEKRWEDLVAAEKALSEDQGLTPLFKPNSVDLVNPKLKGVVYDEINGHYDYTKAYLVK